jgi:Sigma-70, region 4
MGTSTTSIFVEGAKIVPAAVPLPDAISEDLKKMVAAEMDKIAEQKKKLAKKKKKRKAITHDKTKMSRELFGAGIDTPDWPRVKRFLKQYKHLGLSSLLVEAGATLRLMFGEDVKLALEVLKSPVRRSKRASLYLLVKSRLEDEEEGRAYDSFVDSWWANREPRAKGLLAIGIASDEKVPVENVFEETKGSCLSAFKSCQVEWCRFHLHSDVQPSSIAFQKHGEETCVLRIAKKANHTLEEIGEMFGCTRERIRQVETVAVCKVGYKLIKCGVISAKDLSREILNKINSQRRHSSIVIEDDHFRRRKPGRPRKASKKESLEGAGE